MRYQFTFSLFIIYAAYSTIIAQKHDYVWLMGENSLTVPEYAGTVIDFNIQPPDIYYEFRDMFFFQTNASICDTAGNLLFYTNGIYIANALGEPMENGEGLNPGEQAEIWQDYGYILDQGAIALPAPESNHVYYLLHLDKELITTLNDVISRNFYLSLINMSENGGIGKVLSKNNIIITDNLQLGKLTASKHANGRDWWIILRKYASNIFYRFLLTPSGLEILEQQQIGNTIPHNGVGQAVFSPDGAKYAVYETISVQEGHYINIYDFDRCIGELSNPVQINMIDTAWAGGVAISPNNRFLYVSSFKYLYQYDLWAANIESSRITVATWDGFEENGLFATTFYLAQLAPDGKIYINSNNGVSYLHVINNPDSLGLACDVCQHCIDLPTINAVSLPNFPNYRLHHLAGSPCDTLRSPPLALWGYELQGAALHCADSSRHDIRAWHWDFGDGHTDTLQNPVHTYAAGGVYNVCLAVSNPRGADTLCQVVQVVVDGVEEESGKRITVNVSPNPVSRHGQIALDVHVPGAGAAEFVLRDMPGREALRVPLYLTDGRTRQSVSLGSLPAGVYIATLETGEKTVWTGKVVVY